MQLCNLPSGLAEGLVLLSGLAAKQRALESDTAAQPDRASFHIVRGKGFLGEHRVLAGGGDGIEDDESRRPGGTKEGRVYVGDATRLNEIHELDGIRFQYAVTSPPYWSMLTNPGSENQKARRHRNLPLVYSDDEQDLGNIADYDDFLNILESVYNGVAERLADDGMLTVVVKNVKRNHILHPLAWDLAGRLCGSKGSFSYAGTTLWCQDDVGIKPFAVGIYWVSNILHTYCLHFRKRNVSQEPREN